MKEHHYYPISDERLKTIATKANQGGADNLWKYMSDMKWSRRHNQFAVLKSIDEEEELDVSNHDIVIPEDIKLELMVDQYMLRTNFFVEYLHFSNNGALDGFIGHKNNMYVLRAHDRKYRESLARLKKSKILIICQKNPFRKLSSKKIFSTFKNL